MFGLDYFSQRRATGEKRREERQATSGAVRIAHKNYDLVDWSSSGFQARGYKGGFELSDRLAIEFTVDIQDESYFFECHAIVVRTDSAGGRFAGAFVAMDDRDRLAVVQYFEREA